MAPFFCANEFTQNHCRNVSIARTDPIAKSSPEFPKWNVFMVTHVKFVLLCCSGGPSSVVVLGGSATSSGSIPNSRKASASATPHPPPAPTNYDCLERVSLTGSVGGCGAPAEDQLTSSQPHHHHVIQQQQIQPDNLSQKSGSTATTRRATHR